MRMLGNIHQITEIKRLIIISVLSSIIGLSMVFHPESVFRSPVAMDAYFGGAMPPGSWYWNGSWSWQEEPFRYRLLFHSAVDGLAYSLTAVLPQDLTTYWCALLVMLIFSISFAAITLEMFLRQCSYGQTSRSLLLAAWFLMPPIHHAFVLPVQTKEDFVAYGILFLGLRSVLRGDFTGVLVWTLVGAFTRETLLILPGVFFLVSQRSLSERALPLILGVGSYFSIRAVMGIEGYQVYRNENFDSALLVPVSVFFVLGFAWIALPRLITKTGFFMPLKMIFQSLRPWPSAPAASPDMIMQRLLNTFPFVLILLMFAHIFMGRIVEVRISALIAPWILIGFAGLMQGRDLRLTPIIVALPASVALLIVGSEALGIAASFREIVNPRISQFAARIWWLEFYLQSLLLAFSLSFVFFSTKAKHRAV